MKHLTCRLIFSLLFFVTANALAQSGYTITGTITDENHQPIKGATVFISGTQLITASNTDGEFTFGGMAAGNYSVLTNMLGYANGSQDVSIRDKSVTINISLKVKAIMLNEVKIGSDKNWAKYYAMFKDQFLGTSADAKNCVILNPEIINFSAQKLFFMDQILLKANADDFLIIENKWLGYRIKYLLKTFEYNTMTLHTVYDGDNSFEELDGTDEQKKVWAHNRLMVYKGSLMHFLRSVFAGTVLDEGLVANQIYKSKDLHNKQSYIDPNPVKFDTLVTHINNSVVSFKFTALNIIYDPQKAARLKRHETIKNEKPDTNGTLPGKSNNENDVSPLSTNNRSSQLLLYLKEALIDARGSVFSGYVFTFLIRGNWAGKRIGDQLPFEYLPPGN